MRWSDQPSDFQYLPLAELFESLPFTVAVQLVSGSDRWLRAMIRPSIMRSIYSHLCQQNIEMGGLLIGRVFKDDNMCVTMVDAFVPSTEFRGTSVSLQMGTAIWNHARNVQAPGQSIVGWYHSHPNLGAFFSGTDRRTQAAFFTQPHSLGLVVDPIRNEEIWFSGPDSNQLTDEQVISSP